MNNNEYNLDIPHGNTVIWRYLSLDKFIDFVINEELYFANAAQMTDKYEATMPKRNSRMIQKELSRKGFSMAEIDFDIKNRMDSLRQLKRRTLINCWSINPTESYALWKIYLGGSKTGVALKTTVAKLKKSFQIHTKNNNSNIFLSRVRYTDYLTEDPENIMTLIITKYSFYEYEKELRAFIFPNDLNNSFESYNENLFNKGTRVKVEINDLIDEIYVSPFAGKWFEKTIFDLLKRIKPELASTIKNSEILDE